MKVAFYLAHPAHFHLFKNVINNLVEQDIDIMVLYNRKDVLHNLVASFDHKSLRIAKVPTLSNVKTSFDLKIQFIQKNLGAFWKLLRFKPDIVVGTPVLIALIGRILKYKSIIVNEDDFDIVQKTANLGYPHASTIVCPQVCRTGMFAEKCVQYNGYHELAYLHPNHFTPAPEIAARYIPVNKPYAIMRFAKLAAHHDTGIRGIDLNLATKIIEKLKPVMDVFITSEREIEPSLEKYRIKIDPVDMHHVMALAELYIGDSQTMAAESGVLGVPFIRFNDFVGRISYLDEIENNYLLGYGIKPDHPEKVVEKVIELVSMIDRKKVFQSRRQKMLSEKIDTSKFLSWFIGYYPESIEIVRSTTDILNDFK